MQTTTTLPHGVLDPQGPIGAAERAMLLDATVVMAAVIVPVIVMTLAFAWWFRAGNPWARRRPDWAYSGAIEVTVWSVPILAIVFLGGMGWIGAHRLHPARPVAALAGGAPALDVEVVSLDWKWLFIYPDQGVASVNRLVVPVGTPLRLRLTSGSVMNSFFVPQLGSQIYAMGGMTTTLFLRADRAGTWGGLSALFSGDGFSDMRFAAQALPAAQFDEWVARTRAQPDTLDATRLRGLANPGVVLSPLSFGRVEAGLFERIVQRTAAWGCAAGAG